MEKTYNVVDGEIAFMCNECGNEANIYVTKHRRKGYIKCRCGKKQYVKLNWRGNVIRTQAIDKEAYIIVGKNIYPANIKDYSFGGVGLVCRKHLIKKLRLKVGDYITLSFSFRVGKYRGKFIIRSINEKRIGLEYKDGQLLSPEQRIIAMQNCDKGGKK